MGSKQMQTFKAHVLEESAIAAAKKKLKTMTGQQVSFTHATSGDKVEGEYKGLKRMGAHSYAHVASKSGAHYVPVHHIHQTH